MDIKERDGKIKRERDEKIKRERWIDKEREMNR